MAKIKLNWDQKQAAKELGIKKVDKKREVKLINRHLASKVVAPAPTVKPAPSQGIYTQGASVGKTSIPAGRYSEQEYDYLAQSGLLQLQGSLNLEAIQARGLVDTKIASIQAEASRHGADRDAEARKYIADQDLLKGTRVAEIEGQNRLDLQAIINAGLKDVEGIRGQTERDVATLQGEYGIKQESERQRGQKDIAKLGAESSFRNALISAFNF